MCTEDKVISFEKINIKTNHQFHVCFMDGPSNVSDEAKMDILDKSVISFIKDQFRGMLPDEQMSITNSLKKGQAFIIFGIHHKGAPRHIVGIVLFAADLSGIFVNWIAVDGEKFDSDRFGASGNNQDF